MRNFEIRNFIYSCLVVLNVLASYSEAQGSGVAPVEISGWPGLKVDAVTPGFALGNDPVLGRMICPPLTRVNLESKTSEALILSSVTSKDVDGVFKWVMKIRSGIFWWNHEEISASDVEIFLQKRLAEIVREKGGGVWKLPKFSTTSKDDTVEVNWGQKPLFGPFVLNGAPLWREVENSSSGFSYECVGRYIPSRSGESLLLSPNLEYSISKQDYVFKDNRSEERRPSSEITFLMAKSYELDRAAPSCERVVELPLLSLVVWNTEHPTLKYSEARRFLSQHFPRQTLVDWGTGGWGVPLEGFVPNIHPGAGHRTKFNKGPKLRLETAKTLVVASAGGGKDLLGKVLSDQLGSMGLKVELDLRGNRKPDAYVTGLRLPWPEMDFQTWVADPILGRFLREDAELKSLLTQYRLSLTKAQPDFGKLRKIQEWFYRQEPISVLLQHTSCLSFRGVQKKTKARLSARHPDWFIQSLPIARRST